MFLLRVFLPILVGYLYLVVGQDVIPDDPELQRERHANFLVVRTSCAEEFLVPYDHAKDNGDIFIINYDTFDGDLDDITTTTQAPREPDYIDFDEITHMCNQSFIIPVSYAFQFNNTDAVLDDKDLTSMCYFRCFFERSGLMENFKFNVDLVRKYLWPATGDSIEYCEGLAKDEENPCRRTYTIAKCAMLRAATDARNKPMV
ncbi:Odorant-binding protein 84a [Drosophila willistoni]|uniref:Odorant-binding protein 84a n=1 Tax=Drosophila willistoni TaxID=7260 RepID=B4N873_DROWI|nr:Odorant-binding protein 84a [Drosophila willistoni]